jgi:hypothetical protein
MGRGGQPDEVAGAILWLATQNHESLQTVRMARDVARSTVTGLPASEPTIFGHAILETTYSLAGQGRKAANR